MKIFGLGCVDLISHAHALHSYALYFSFHAFLGYVLDYIVNVLVWIGFLIMMALYFARHMLMHSHALFISLLLYSKYVCCFFSTLAFLTMAPKVRNFVPSKNPISRCGSSTSIPFHEWFRDTKSQNDLKENFSGRSIHVERQVLHMGAKESAPQPSAEKSRFAT